MWNGYRGANVVWSGTPAVSGIDDTFTNRFLVRIPANCNVESIEVLFNGLSATGLSATVGTWRDAAGDAPFVPSTLASKTQTIEDGQTTGGAGSVKVPFDADHHPHPTLNENEALNTMTQRVDADLYVGVALSAGATGNVTDIGINYRLAN